MATKKHESDNSNQETTALVLHGTGAGIASLPPAVQAALKKYKTRELAGFAQDWKPTEPGQFVLGQVVSIRHEVGKYKSTIVTLQTPDGPLSVWLSADLKMKFGDESPVGRNFVIQYQGKLLKSENPKLANDMKVFNVVEVLE